MLNKKSLLVGASLCTSKLIKNHSHGRLYCGKNKEMCMERNAKARFCYLDPSFKFILLNMTQFDFNSENVKQKIRRQSNFGKSMRSTPHAFLVGSKSNLIGASRYLAQAVESI